VGRAVRLSRIVSPVSSENSQAITETSEKARELVTMIGRWYPPFP